MQGEEGRRPGGRRGRLEQPQEQHRRAHMAQQREQVQRQHPAPRQQRHQGHREGPEVAHPDLPSPDRAGPQRQQTRPIQGRELAKYQAVIIPDRPAPQVGGGRQGGEEGHPGRRSGAPHGR